MSKSKPIYQDEHILLVNKPAGWLSIPDRYDEHKANLLTHWRKQLGDMYTVHRLDQDTSGIICFARTEEAHRHLSLQFQNRSVDKLYWAIVEGVPGENEGRIEAPIRPVPNGRGKMQTHPKGKASITDWTVRESAHTFALLECRILTGRMHQIRVHMAHLGHPILCDPLYGRRTEFLLSQTKGKKYNIGRGQTERPLLTRTALHAYRLEIEHPNTGERRSFEAEPPKDIRASWRQIMKWG